MSGLSASPFKGEAHTRPLTGCSHAEEFYFGEIASLVCLGTLSLTYRVCCLLPFHLMELYSFKLRSKGIKFKDVHQSIFLPNSCSELYDIYLRTSTTYGENTRLCYGKGCFYQCQLSSELEMACSPGLVRDLHTLPLKGADRLR